MITLSLQELGTLLFREHFDENHPSCAVKSPQSTIIGDLAKPVIVPRDIGEQIKQEDENEAIFHVEFFPTHAEVWTRFEWKESNARRDRIKSILNQERTARENHRQLVAEIADELTAYKIPESHAAQLAEQMTALYRMGKVSELIKIFELDKVFNKKESNEKEIHKASHEESNQAQIQNQGTNSQAESFY